MDNLQDPTAPKSPASVPTAAPQESGVNPWMLTSGVLVLVVLVGVAAWIFTTAKSPVVDTQIQGATTTPVAQSQIPAGWRVYENKKIGIAFNYPEAWGEVVVADVEGGCDSPEAQAEIAATHDPCIQIVMRFPSPLYASGGIFLATETALHQKYPVGRGAFWGDEFIPTQQAIEHYCDGKSGTCVVSKNSNGVTIAKTYLSAAAPGDMGEQQEGWVYRLYSPNSVYQSIIISAVRLDARWQVDFDRLVDTLRFI